MCFRNLARRSTLLLELFHFLKYMCNHVAALALVASSRQGLQRSIVGNLQIPEQLVFSRSVLLFNLATPCVRETLKKSIEQIA